MRVFIVSLMAASAGAWVSPSVSSRRSTSLVTCFEHLDSSAAVADALRISKEFGAASVEARVAWDIVEEMDAADNTVAINEPPKFTVKEQVARDYAMEVRSLAYLLQDTREKIGQIKTLATNLKEMELEDPALSKLDDDAAALKTVLSEAKAAMEKFGPDSPEAAQAWEQVDSCAESEECDVDTSYRYSAAALKAHHYYDAVVDTVFLQEAIEALDTVDSLRRFIQIENNRLSGRGLTT